MLVRCPQQDCSSFLVKDKTDHTFPERIYTMLYIPHSNVSHKCLDMCVVTYFY